MILALETSTNVCSVALQVGDDIIEKRSEERGAHSEALFLFIDELMKEYDLSIEDLEAVLVSNGPGSYTGLRIAVSALKGLLFSTEVPVYAVNTLAGIAKGAELKISENCKRIISVLNARRQHVYCQIFNARDLSELQAASIIEIEKLMESLTTSDHIAGTGIQRFGSDITDRIPYSEHEVISAVNLIRLFQNDMGKNYCTLTDIQALRSDYLNTGQVNDSRV